MLEVKHLIEANIEHKTLNLERRTSNKHEQDQ